MSSACRIRGSGWVFIYFSSQLCQECKRMRKAWEKMEKVWGKNTSVLIGEIDCSQDGDALCKQMQVEKRIVNSWGFKVPLILYGDPELPEEYPSQAMGYTALNDFVETKFQQRCNPLDLDTCDNFEKKKIELLQKFDAKSLDKQISAKMEEVAENRTFFREGKYENATAAKEALEHAQKSFEEKHKELMSEGLWLMKSVLAAEKVKLAEKEAEWQAYLERKKAREETAAQAQEPK
eukprot:gnl/TRDRNA2_/TRDRNA2_80617_c0_seq2.p1 gnl/TRDRNA2_/TRDRNA2_80617_c0~~gnl/TRDRNA2_/TRDRNA2_80617_c0_seq2.p1  ORF type:complete len:235 (+),score=68.78 gnl/TRDRNA2_/TRDRNA2_80617_c0_seq2:198-902(+)